MDKMVHIKDSPTHGTKGEQGGVTAGIESGVSKVSKYQAGMGQDIVSGSQRAKPEKRGSIATK